MTDKKKLRRWKAEKLKTEVEENGEGLIEGSPKESMFKKHVESTKEDGEEEENGEGNSWTKRKKRKLWEIIS